LIQETSKEYSEFVVGLGPDGLVAEVTLNETSDKVTLDL